MRCGVPLGRREQRVDALLDLLSAHNLARGIVAGLAIWM